MASRLSQEEENYVRMSLLLTGISPRAARALFDHEFAPACLESSMKREYNKLKDLQKKRVINQSQWNLLFPRFPDVPDSKTFDVTLIITLLRNLTNLIPPHGGFDHLPSDNETTPSSDLARIKYYRNFLAHLDEGKVESTTFTSAWDNVTSAISRLGGQPMKQECDDLKVKILDQTNQEIMLDIKRSSGEIMELKKSVESLKKVNEDMKIEVNKLKTSQEDTVPWSIRAWHNKTIEQWITSQDKTVITASMNKLHKMVQSNIIVTVTGSSGCGKSTAIHYVAIQMRKDNYEIVPVHSIVDILTFQHPDKKQLFIAENIFGKYSLRSEELDNWNIRSVEINFLLQETNVKIIVLNRSYIHNHLSIKEIKPIFYNVCDLSSPELCLKDYDRLLVAKMYLEEVEVKTLIDNDHLSRYDFFPLLCSVYSNHRESDLNTFFLNPELVIADELLSFKKNDQTKYATLALLVVYNNLFTDNQLTIKFDMQQLLQDINDVCVMPCYFSKAVVSRELQCLLNSYVKKTEEGYQFLHGKLFDIALLFYGQHMFDIILKHAVPDIIRDRFTFASHTDDDFKQAIKVPKEREGDFFFRLYQDLTKDYIYEVFTNRQLENKQYQSKFVELCESNNDFCSFINEMSKLDLSKVLHLSSQKGHDDIVRLLLIKYKADPNVRYTFDNIELNALYAASINGHSDVTKLLLEFEADPNFIGQNCLSVLSIVAYLGKTNVAKILLNEKADPNIRSKDNITPLHAAALTGQVEVAELLIQYQCDMTLKDIYGKTPLHYAATEDFPEMVSLLLNHNSDPDIVDNESQTPLFLAIAKGKTENVELLLGQNANPNICRQKDTFIEAPLHRATKEDKTKMVNILLRHNADPDICMEHNITPLFIAALEGKEDIVDILLENNANPNIISSFESVNATALTVSCNEGCVKIARILLEHGANINLCAQFKQSPLFIACHLGHANVVELLLKHNADLNICESKFGMSPLFVACHKCHVDIIHLLFKHGAQCNAIKYGITPLHNAVFSGHADIVKILLNFKADSSIPDIYNNTPLALAVVTNNFLISELLLRHDSNPDLCSKASLNVAFKLYQTAKEGLESRTACSTAENIPLMRFYSICEYCWYTESWHEAPIYIASDAGYLEIVKLLLQYKADPNVCNKLNNSPLFIASYRGNYKICKALCEQQIDVNSTNNLNHSPLITASDKGYTEVVRLLLENHADVNICSSCSNESALLKSVRYGYKDIVALLLQHNADPDISNVNNQSPLFIALSKGHVDIAKILLEKDCNVNIANMDEKRNTTPLFVASMKGYTDVVEDLLAKGADPNISDKYNITPLFLACSSRSEEIVKLLLNHNADCNVCACKHSYTILYQRIDPFHDEITELLSSVKELDIKELCQSKGHPLFVAAWKCCKNIVRTLLDHEICFKKIENCFCKNVIKEIDLD